jgi:hypothetical protein
MAYNKEWLIFMFLYGLICMISASVVSQFDIKKRSILRDSGFTLWF